MSDLIDRQRAIEAVKLGITYAKLIDTETGELLEPFKASNDELKRAVQRIKNLPSAQPTFDARDTQYNLPIGTDCISRQALLDKFEPWLKVKDYNDGELNMLKAILYEIRFMRSAQPEPCEDAVSRKTILKFLDDWMSALEDNVHNQSASDLKIIKKDFENLPSAEPQIIRCKDCKHHWTHKCMDSMPIERCDLEQTFYDAEHDFCSLAERREVTT